ncbi:hypothetical protein [Candidatus Nesciobacter abundans]|uniref:Uncharacterized protein n=1 Tax=Candidatus Nesciobacter abundans TaxID=2601668 RepID=A0A5C0UG56_9PROT|nr:hypothetical protein [Candidatus Nesciobacter abundans]QEK39086.1 hypothetical protein FZC36_01385 [Candidatus Nesciobacter abundans]
MIKIVFRKFSLLKHLFISSISIFLQIKYAYSKNLGYLFAIHFWYFICFENVSNFKLKSDFFVEISKTAVFGVVAFFASKYFNVSVYFASYSVMYFYVSYLGYKRNSKLIPDVIIISEKIMHKWPVFAKYKIIGELILDSDNIENIKNTIKKAKPSIILWNCRAGNYFADFLGWSIKNNIYINYLRKDKPIPPSIEHCMEDFLVTNKIDITNKEKTTKKVVIFSHDIGLLTALYREFKKNNLECFVFLDAKSSIAFKIKLYRQFGKQVLNKSMIRKVGDFLFIDCSGIISFKEECRDIKLLEKIKERICLVSRNKGDFFFLSTKTYNSEDLIFNQLTLASENIVKFYNGKVIKTPYLANYSRKLCNYEKNSYINMDSGWITKKFLISSISNIVLHNHIKLIESEHFLTKKDMKSICNNLKKAWFMWSKPL